MLGNCLRISVCANSSAFSSTLTGNVVCTNNSTTVTGVGTAFTNELTVGDYLTLGPDKLKRKIGAIASTTSLTLQRKYVGNNVTNGAATSATPTREWEFNEQFESAPGTSDFVSQEGGLYDEMHIVIVDEYGVITGSANNAI